MRKVFAVLLIMLVVLPLNLGAAANSGFAEIIIEIDYVNEVIRLSGKSGERAVKYMYSPNVSVAAETNLRRQVSERWFPVYGNEINITRFIPNGRNNSFIFAFRDADEIAGANGIFTSRRTTTIIRGRPIFSASEFRAAIVYNPQTERIYIDSSFGPYDFQVGNGVWILNNTAPFIDASSRFNPLGGVFMIRASAVPDRSFASNEFRLSIPRAPAAPNIRINERTQRLTGVRTTMQWSASPDGPFINFRDRTGNLDIFRGRLFTETRDANGNESIVVYIRVAATNRLPSSPPQKLLINKDFIG